MFAKVYANGIMFDCGIGSLAKDLEEEDVQNVTVTKGNFYRYTKMDLE